MTSFIDIYSRAMTLLKSPVLSRLQSNDLYTFCIVMNQYLDTAITLYNPNAETNARLEARRNSDFNSNEFVADGQTNAYVLTGNPQPNEDSIFKVFVGDKFVRDFHFDAETNSLVFGLPPVQGEPIGISWVNVGNFDKITTEDATLLAMALCWAWAIQTQNNQLDIDRQPNDSDFKLHSEATTTNAKVDWVKHYEEMFKRELSKADWRSIFRRSR